MQKLREDKKEIFLKRKLKWLANTKKIFGNCGAIAYINNKSVAYAQYAPWKLLPNYTNYNEAPSGDSILISCFFYTR